MKETIFRYARSIRVRIISAFMAILIIFAGMPYVGLEYNNSVDAAQQITAVTKSGEFLQKYTVESTSHSGHSVVKNSGNENTDYSLTYRYTGAVKTTKVSLYDYKSDAEIPTGNPNNKYTNWGSEPFDTFNTAISNIVKDTEGSQNQNNITICFENTLGWSTVYIYLWNDKGNSGWKKHQMTYDSSSEKYVITFNLVDSSADNYLKYDSDVISGNFVPKHLIFHNGTNQTIDLNATLINGYSYSFKTVNGTDSANHYKCERTGSTRIIFDAGSLDIDSDGLYLHCWGNGGTTTWPGEKMTKMDGTTKYYLDFKGNFDPYEYLLTNGRTGSGNKQYCSTSNKCFNRVLKYGWTYEFKCEEQTGGTYKTTIYNVINPTNPALFTNAKVCKYTNPLYFGCYYRTTQIAGTYADDFKPDGVSTYTGDSTINFGGPYRNFWWQANLGMKSTGDGTGSNSVDVRGHAAVQGIVNTTLKSERKYTDTAYNATTNPNVLKLTQGPEGSEVELPYFSYQFQKDHSNMMSIYDNSGNGVDFPFYEILADAKNVRGDVTTGTDTARFYQFCSDDVNLRFDTSSQQFLEETNTRIKSNNSKTGYFPFNDSSSTAPSAHNLGFGTKFEMKFKLSSNGTVKTLDANGEKTTDGNIHTMFEFFGDDDLWVFLDGKLLLDLGGTHDQTSGLIDFYEMKAYANKALTLGDGGSKDNLGADVGIKIVEPADFKTILGETYTEGVGYDEYCTHTMTIFYLERGMMDSNLMIRFNYKPESNFSKMKVQEITDFSGVNAGLQDLTKKAADSDVFQYTLSNKDTKASDTLFTGILYPTYDTYQRKYKEDAENTMIDQLTGQTLEYEDNEQTDETAVFLNTSFTSGSNSRYWEQDNAVIAAWIWKSDEGGKLYIGSKVHNRDHVYQFKGYPSDANKILFLRLNPAGGPFYSGAVEWSSFDSYKYNQSSDLTLTSGRLYSITGWNAATAPQNGDPPYSFPVLRYYKDNNAKFNPPDNSQFNAVTNTNYLWVDKFAKLVGTEVDDINGFTGRTDGSGNLYLMYGSGNVISEGTKLKVSGVESSAEFENQFKRDSTMKVIQQDTLKKTERNNVTETFSGTLSRSVDYYYNTTVYAFDRAGEAFKAPTRDVSQTYVLNQSKNETTKNMETEFKFNNNPTLAPDSTMTVMMTEVFENSPNTGNLTVTKDIEDPAGNTESNVTREFEYKLTLTNVFDINGVNVTNTGSGTGYEKIATKKNTTTGNALTNSGETASTFTLKPGESLTIEDIPVGTHYKIEEIGEKVSGTTIAYYEYNKVYKKVESEWTNQNNSTGVIEGDIETDTTHEYKYANKRKVGNLTLSKSLVGQSNAETEVGENTTFKLNVTLQADTEVNIQNYLGETPTFTCGTGTSVTNKEFDTNNNGKYTFTATIKPSQTIKLDNIPYGTTVTVEEEQDTNRPVASYAYTDGGSNTYTNVIEHPSTVVTVTNTYRQITLTKTDSKDNSKKLQGAVYYLLRLKTGANTNDAQTAFEAADASYDTTTLTNCFDVVSGELTTEQNGTIVIKDSNVTNGLVPGDYYLFEQSAPSDYTRQNSFSANKITINNTESGDAKYTINLNNVRKTGTLELEKAVATGSPTNKTFTFTVNLNATAENLNLNNYSISGLSNTSNPDSNTGKLQGTVTVNAGNTAEISGIPFGTTYTVDEESETDWVKVSRVYSDDNKVINTEHPDKDTVTITNAKTGSLTINKTVEAAAGATLPDTLPEFTFSVSLAIPDGLNWSSFSPTLTNMTGSDGTYTATINGAGTASITGIPYGTEYTVTEGDVEKWTRTVPTSNGNCTGSISSLPSQANFTNQYTYIPPAPTDKSITLTKTDLNGNPLSDVEFALLKLNSEVDIANDEVKTAFTTGNWSTYATQVGSNKVTGANGQVTFTEDGSTITFENGGRYFFYEVSVPSGSNIIIDNSLTAEKIITIGEDESYNRTYKNRKTVSSVDVTVVKTDENGTGLKDAEFELWYKDSTVHPTYTFNDPLTAPLKKTALKVSGTGITVPSAAVPSSYTTYDYTYTYSEPNTPSANETEWILPRTDNDYIYFRDFESGTADHDPGLSKHAWLDTSFETNTYSQEQEIKYDHKYWFAAQFRKSDNSGFVEYAVWERFVDKYENYDTIVWKIQPPDGYSKVRFCLYDGGNCIRTTKEFNYQLGKIYQKTNWGGIYSNGNYYNVPVDSGQNWSTYYSTTSSSYDQRNANTTSLNQAERYEPTEQKIIFHCNSQQVWHNIHIEFFGENQTPIHQKFPGYMMEPYAYAGSDYRLSNGYLTYELTIPSDAKYFRINNGIDNSTTKGSFDANSSTQSPYAYRTNIQAISTSGNKNNDNYYILGDNINARYSCLNGTTPQVAQLKKNVNAITSLSHEDTSTTYSSNEVESDCDYIYFAKKKTDSIWNGHIYAYFYGGGNLREDNWQRACYSIWPGVAPVGTQFNDGSGHNSTIYDYTPSANPESTFTIKKGGTEYTVYKFRMPEGDRKNYSKVIFNDGLKQHSGSKETSPITYNAGYIYFEDGGSMKHFDNYSTTQYSKRPGNDDYIYIKTSDTAWDDMHITFYDSNGSQIHQGGTGYVMKYAGTSGGETYYRIPIPADADKFKLNNGRDKATSLETDFGDILRKSSSSTEGNKVSDYTEGKIVYTLDNTDKLTMVPLFTKTEVPTVHSSEAQNSKVDYAHTRGDKLYIRNTAGWTIDAGGGQVKFYKANGDLITGNGSDGNGTYILIKTVNDGGDPAKEWYSIEIPDDAVSFTLTYNGGANTTARNPIYPKSADGTVTDSNGNYTTGNMYYQTTSGGALSLMTTTVSPATTETDITAAKRGDTLYLLCTNKTEWENMTVTFLNSSGTAITGATDITANYIGQQDGDHWWSISIPTGAASFTVTKGGNTTTAAEIYPLSQKLSRYKKDYTLGDMQYRLPDPAASSKPGLLYPIFTQDDEYTLEVGGKTITTSSGTALVDETAIANYANANAVTTPATSGNEPTSPYPVLYSTTTDKLTYSWTEGTGSTDKKVYFVQNSAVSGWSTPIQAHFWEDNQSGSDYAMSIDHNDSDGNSVWAVAVPGENVDNVAFHQNENWDNKTENLTLVNHGYGSVYTPALPHALVFKRTDLNHSGGKIYADFYDSADNHLGSPEGDTFSGDDTKWFAIPDDAAKVKFSYGADNWATGYLTLDSSNGYGYGKYYKAANGGTPQSMDAFNYSNLVSWAGASNSWTDGVLGTTTHTATYQPEDRYGFITSRDDYSSTPADTNNFIYIETEIPDPYITFYDSSSNVIGGNDMADAGIKLKGVCGNSASPYKIRLPRNAKSFKLADGASGILGTAIPLEENITVNAETGQPASSGNTTPITNYRHAGTTFTVDSNGTVTSKTLRSGFTISKTAALSETSPKSDIDYVFFTNTNTTLTGTVYAYFYGSADGEFARWPGIQSESSYTDNAGKTVYRFRIPKGTNGTYAKVIFNNGSDAGRKITQAVDAIGGKNYTLDTTEANRLQYGTYNGTTAINAYAVADSTKANSTGGTVYGSNRYIYIYNNGTQNLTNGVDTGTYKLDEMHVIFYDINNTPIGSADSGYIPDRLIVSNAVTDYYRMQVPNGAVYFQITNGTGKGTGSNYYSRQSEIKQITANGLYEFVSGKTNAADFITADSTVPTGNNATREAPKYLLTLKNEKKAELDDDVPETSTFDVKLAVVVTGDNGTQKYIKWLKQSGSEVDQVYLNHTNADVGETAGTGGNGIKVVSVVKNGTYYWKEVVAPAGYELNENTFEFIKTDSTTSTVTTTVTDKKISGKVILTKTAKEKVGTTNIGDPLPGAQFKLVRLNGNTENSTLRFTLTTVDGKNTYSLGSNSASYNNTNYWLTTGSDGKLTIEGLSPGDYYLEEQTAPAGYSEKDSNVVVNNVAQKKKVYFSIGDNTTTKYLTCSDEMAPAYIKLYEHINEKKAAWGDPTFIFKITQTGYYKNDGTSDIETISNGKTMIVALTVDDDGKFTTDTVLGSDYNGWYQESTDELEGESPKKREYQGMYHIDSEGKIRLEPGTYSITRVPVSRYEFVADTWKLEDDTTANIYTTNKHTETNQTMTGSEPAIQNVTIPQGKTALVHYYDKVAYYDKFSHVDTKINQFYKLDGDKNNTTAKGIRVEYKPKVGTDVTEADINITNNDDFKAWFINVDGTERAMNDSDKAKLVISCLPTDNNNADTLAFLFQSPTIKISTPSNFKDKVYTLTAEYKENNQTKFTTKFDLVFERSS